MAIYHNTAKVIARSSPRSTLAITAYISRDKARDDERNLTYDFTSRKDLMYSEIILPETAPEEYMDREKLWNAVEKTENGNGQTARTFEVALPIELNKDEQIKLVREYVKDNFIKQGMCADMAIHDKGDGNPHAHIMLTMRPLNENGEWEHKSIKVYLCKNREGEERGFTAKEWQEVKDEWAKQLPYYRNGNLENRLIYLTKYEAEHDERYREYKRVKGKNDPKHDKEKRNPLTAQWNSEETFIKWREDWAVKVNAELERKDITQRIDHRSYEAQGIDKIPTKHVGAIATQYERHGTQTERGNTNRKIKSDNRQIEILNRQIKETQIEIKGIQQDKYITEIHEQTDGIKNILNKNMDEQMLIKCRETIEALDKMMTLATAVNYNTNRVYNLKNDWENIINMSYIDYHREKYQRESNNLRMVIEVKRLTVKGDLKPVETQPEQPHQPITPPVSAADRVDIKAVAVELEERRREYISVIRQINENSKSANLTENRIYEIQMTRIRDIISEIGKLDRIISRAENEKQKLGLLQGRARKERQATIKRSQEQRGKQIQKLQELGVPDISQANRKINELEKRAVAEGNRVWAVKTEITQLKELKAEMQKRYHGVKNSFSVQQRRELEQYQAKYRPSEDKKRYFSLDDFTAMIQADRELEPERGSSQEQSKNRSRPERDDR